MNPSNIQLGRAIAEARIAEARHINLVKAMYRKEPTRRSIFIQRIGRLLISIGTNLIEKTQESQAKPPQLASERL